MCTIQLQAYHYCISRLRAGATSYSQILHALTDWSQVQFHATLKKHMRDFHSYASKQVTLYWRPEFVSV